ncbi:TetR family transcriptional regulator [Cryptosporangium arvum]|jgi:AcrR family transcriptional regulator|uniref:Transcriptional regulator n=1 Tax=Cryptosporangium arvum DSM 44712 TaxID=927661 RepID=A0A010ZW96_9ACTN|nr:TetR family transcriptional regulator [Cryptosporangium arvum]EXG82939.1 transcriptional regulator [Cryptosporangium arvum DSM 44712]
MSDSTRERIVAAARAEFAQYGIAGARVARIAANAKTSKERVYAYFSSKEDLYRLITAEELGAIARATRIDVTDLPGYAGRVHDYFTTHPERARLLAWGRLELGTTEGDPLRRAVAGKLGQLRKAQEAGRLDPAWDPVDVLMLINQMAMTWADQPDFVAAVPEPERAAYLAARRAAIVTAVERLFPATAPAPGPV